MKITHIFLYTTYSVINPIKLCNFNYNLYLIIISVIQKDKWKLLFDCASKYRGKSLNDCCFRGPDWMNNLSYVLLNFPVHRYAIQADIKVMYNQVCIPVSDRNSCSFFGLKYGKLVHYCMSSHLFGCIRRASASIYALRHTIQNDPDVLPIVRDYYNYDRHVF